MTIHEAIKNRHSVRSFTDVKINSETKSALLEEIKKCNSEGGLNIQLILGEPSAFKGFMARYGKFKNVNNYIAVVGKDDVKLDELAGYYGERIVLMAQQSGLNTCWVSTSFRRGKCAAEIRKDEKLVCVIALGYGKTQGTPHKSKPMESFYKSDVTLPEWFHKGMDAVILAPTGLNRQNFFFTLVGSAVEVYAKNRIDLGIVKYHFEVGAGKENFVWK